jgi:chromate reductase
MQYHLRQTLVFVEALVLNKPEVMIGQAQDKMDATPKLTDTTTRDIIKAQLAAFEKFIRRVAA